MSSTCPRGHPWAAGNPTDACPVCTAGGPAVDSWAATSDGGVADELPPAPAAETTDLGAAAFARAADRPSGVEGPGAVIGPYRLVRELGQGGFGAVYLAEQERPVRRAVALKVLKPGMDTGQVLARFEAERQALARMDHPNIAKVHDAGATPTGRPFFVMELVEGVPITDFCDRDRLPPADRLRLFVDVCQAIQHAHHKGVIHRDIKPSNVLVARHDGKPVVKVIDFGVAKATAEKLTERTLHTGLGQLVGTPLYMSPEQADAGGLDIDTRSDVYALGVLLYELLTGTTPLEWERVRRVDYSELLRVIQEEDPPRPSTRLSGLGASGRAAAECRGSDVRRLTQLLSGDLDWIVMKALEKDRARRYETPNSLAADVGRYLRREPVVARPPSVAYRLTRFAQRNRAAVLAVSAVVAAVLVGTGAAVWQAVAATRAAARERQAKETAEAREAESRAVLDFVENKVLAAARPAGLYGGLGRDVTVRQAIDAALPFIESSFRDQPLVEARLRMSVGWSFSFLGEFRTAADQFQAAHALYAGHLGDDHPDTLKSVVGLAVNYGSLGRRAEALRLFDETLARQKDKLGPDHPDTLWTMHFLAVSHMRLGQLARAVELNEETLALRKARLGPDHPDTLWSMSNLATCFGILGRHEEAQRLHDETLALRAAKLGPHHPDTLESMNQVALVHAARRRFAEALDLHEKALALRRDTLGPDHPDTLASRHHVAECLDGVGRHPDALRLREETLPLLKRKLGVDHPHTLWFMHLLADSYDTARRRDDARKLRREAVDLARNRMGPDSAEALGTMHMVAAGQVKLGEREAALQTRREALALATRIHGPNHADTLFAMQEVAISLIALRRDAEALDLLRDTLARRREHLGPDHADTLWTLLAAGERLVILKRGAEAVPLLDEYVQRAGGNPANVGMLLAAVGMRFGHFKTTTDVASLRTTAEMWEQLNCADANCYYNAACMRAVTAAVLRAADKSPAAARQADGEADRAMAWLVKAIAAGFNNRRALAFDPDLNDLRGRADFKELIATPPRGGTGEEVGPNHRPARYARLVLTILWPVPAASIPTRALQPVHPHSLPQATICELHWRDELAGAAMTAEDWIDVIRLVPEAEHGKLVIVLQNSTELCVDTIIRYESQFLVLRGRQGGTVEQARAFFVPYDQMLCLRLDRVVKVEEIQEFFGTPSETLAPAPLREMAIIPASSQPIANVPTDPAVASRLLLERIRQMRANSAPRYSS